MKQSTIRTVAKAAGVSIATVSRTFSNPSLVSEEVRQRVENAATKLHFKVQSRPRQKQPKAGDQVRRIGFLVPEQVQQLADETVTEEIWKGAHQALAARNVDLVMGYAETRADGRVTLPKQIAEDGVDGLLVRPLPNRTALLETCRNRTVVVVGNSYADAGLPFVGADDFAGMKLALNYLVELGHRRIAFVSPPTCGLIYARRLQAYRLFQMERGEPANEQWIKVADSKESWWVTSDESADLCRRFLAELLGMHPRPTAIACATDAFAAGLISAAQERGVKLPEELSITGFGNRQYSLFTHPPLTTVHVDQRAIGAWGAHMLLSLIAGAFPRVQTLVQPRLVERRSCARAEPTTTR